MKTLEEIKRVVSEVKFLDRDFVVMQKGDGYLFQLRYPEKCVDTGMVMMQHSRKWYISPYMTTSEIVQTALKACLTSMEHVVRENFYYKGERIFGPHHDVDTLVMLAKEKRLKQDKR